MRKIGVAVIILVAISAVTAIVLSAMKPGDGSESNGSPTMSTSRNTSSSQYSASDVSIHNSRTDCWITINSKVYNVTGFLDQHPGGVQEITPYCGKDATQAFATQGGRGSHSSQADSMLTDYLIGNLK